MQALLEKNQLPKGCKVIVLPEENPQTDASMFSSLPEIMNCKKAAEALGVCEKTVRELAITGKIKGFKIGKVWRFSRQSLIEFVRGGEDEKV